MELRAHNRKICILCVLYAVAFPAVAKSALSKDTAKYVVVDVSGGPQVSARMVRASETPPDISGDVCRTGELWFRRLPGFDGLAVSVFEITQAQYEAVTGGNPSRHPGELRPVENVSWNDAVSFAATLSRQTGLVVDLPTDAEWEFACRAGTKTPYYNGKSPSSHLSPELNPIARYGNNRHDGKGGGYAEHVHVGSYEPNPWGLYDMLGNVSEWTKDWASDKFPEDWQSDRFPGNRYKSLRGGNWYPCMETSTALSCTASDRGMARYVGATTEYKSDLAGFRVVIREKGSSSK